MRLEETGYTVAVAHDGAQTLRHLARRSFSLVLLDMMLPDMDGLDLLVQLRSQSMIPILVTSARQDQGDRMAALELGADSYLAKPFEARELRARIAACLRRAGPPWSEQPGFRILQAAGVRLDVPSRQVWVDDQSVQLTPKEFDLLRVLLSRCGHVCRSAELLWEVWGYGETIHTRTLSVHMSRLREKLATPSNGAERVATIPGVGYMLAEPTGDS